MSSTDTAARCWRELEALGASLSAGDIKIADAVSQALRYLEIPRTPEQQAVATLLTGILDKHEADL